MNILRNAVGRGPTRVLAQGLLLLVVVTVLFGCLDDDSDEQNPPSGGVESCLVNRVVDGDGIRLNCGLGRSNLNVRLQCIGAPESDQQPWGDRATDHLRALIGPTVGLWSMEFDRYGRTVGRIYRGGEDLNLRMVADGKVAVYPEYCDDDRYYQAERIARGAGIGIWSEPGFHQEPWEWRRIR